MKKEWDKSLFSMDFDVLVSITTKTGIRNSHGVFHFKCLNIERYQFDKLYRGVQ